MVVVSGTFKFPAGSAQAVREAMDKCVAETLKEEGCISYRFYPDMHEPDVYRVFEEWESGKHLGAHGQSAHLAEFRETLGKLGVMDRDVKLYKVSESRGL